MKYKRLDHILLCVGLIFLSVFLILFCCIMSINEQLYGRKGNSLEGDEYRHFIQHANVSPEKASLLVKEYERINPHYQWRNDRLIYAVVDGKYFFPAYPQSKMIQNTGYWIDPFDGNLIFTMRSEILRVKYSAFQRFSKDV